MNITESSVRRPVTVLIMTLLFTGLAVFMIPDLAVDMFPSTTYPIIMINTAFSGASPEEVEESVTIRLEKQLSNLSGIENITSTSSEGRSSIRLEFGYDTDLDEATNDIRDALSRIAASLPDGASSPQIWKFDGTGITMMRMIVQGNESPDTLTRLAEEIIQPRLERVEGVASAEVTGGETREVRVELSLNRMEAYGISMAAVSNALRNRNILLSGGDLEKNGMSYSLRVNERFTSLDDIRRTIISRITTVSSSGSANRSNVVRLEDIADISIDVADRYSRVYVNGAPSIYVEIQNESDTNTVQVSNAVRDILPQINEELPAGVSLEILYDRTTMISSVLNQVYVTAFQGGLLAMLILFLFLRTVKSTLVVGISIPVSIFITLGAMYFFDLTLNMISLTGLILGLGMIVDSSIVILENIYKYRERGAKLTAAAILGSREMVTAITASTLTTLCVFIPMIIWKDKMEMLGQMMQDMIFTIVISLISSLIIALTLVPALSSTYLKIDSRVQKPLKNSLLKKVDSAFEGFFTGLETRYLHALGFALRNRFLVLSLVATLLVLSIARFATMGMVFQPQSSSDDSVTISLEMPVGTSLDRTERALVDMKKIIEEKVAGYTNIIVRAGSGGFRSTSSYRGRIEIMLPPVEDQTDTPDTIKEKLRPALSQIPDATFAFSSGRYRASSNPVDIEIISSDIVLAGNTALEIRDIIRDIPDVVDPVSSLENGAPEYRVVINNDRAAALGLSVTAVATAIDNLVEGITPVTYWLNGEELNVSIQLKEDDRNTIADLDSLFILGPSGERITLSNLASFDPVTGPVSINRENEKRVVHVTSQITQGTTAMDVLSRIRKQLDDSYIVPDGVTLSFSGEVEEISRIRAPLVIILVVAIIMVFSVMASLFESLVDPFIIFFSIPLLLIGVTLIHTVLGQTISMYSIVGMVVLVGIVVNNGIVLVDYTNLLRHKGAELMDACREGARSRLRPVLMTSLTTMLGMVPLGFFPAKGTEAIQAIGQTMVGGLLGSTFFTLFVTPVIYSLLNRDRKVYRKKAREQERISHIIDAIPESGAEA